MHRACVQVLAAHKSTQGVVRRGTLCARGALCALLVLICFLLCACFVRQPGQPEDPRILIKFQ